MKAVLKYRWVFVSLLLLVICHPIAAQNRSKNEPVRIARFANLDLAAILAQLAADQDVPIGFEVDSRKPWSPIVLELANVTTREILEASVRSEPLYQLHDGGDFIEVFPVKTRSAFLDTPVSSFDLKDVDGSQAIEELLNRPEVEAIRSSMNLKRQPARASAGRSGERSFSVHIEATSLRQALNQIARSCGSNFWIFRPSQDGSFFLGLSVN